MKGTWKDEPSPAAGQIYDLGSHLIDQALVLFGRPESLTAFKQNTRGIGHPDVDDSVCSPPESPRVGAANSRASVLHLFVLPSQPQPSPPVDRDPARGDLVGPFSTGKICREREQRYLPQARGRCSRGPAESHYRPHIYPRVRIRSGAKGYSWNGRESPRGRPSRQ